ncbi:hypothetical protein [Nostoc sp. 106C]|uniref:hypothetical protein n=1 Tax=Nostoc sp. 106C TaxID=1932667 RepID=UPI001180D17B|nr:hypothetical protein [Nostoc sp. 106C]
MYVLLFTKKTPLYYTQHTINLESTWQFLFELRPPVYCRGVSSQNSFPALKRYAIAYTFAKETSEVTFRRSLPSRITIHFSQILD